MNLNPFLTDAGTRLRALATIALGAAAMAVAPAEAGGLAAPAAEAPVVVEIAPDFADFTGFYVGAQLGYAFGGADDVGIDPPGTNAGRLKNQGAFGGIVAGYRWQPRVLVLGIVGELNAADITDSLPSGAATTTNTWMASLRLMAGIPNGRTLTYATLGVATGGFDYEVNGGGMALDTSFTTTGPTAGIGIERDLGNDWSLIGEYRYTKFGKVDLYDAADVRTRATPKYNSVSIGIARRF